MASRIRTVSAKYRHSLIPAASHSQLRDPAADSSDAKGSGGIEPERQVQGRAVRPAGRTTWRPSERRRAPRAGPARAPRKAKWTPCAERGSMSVVTIAEAWPGLGLTG